MRGSTAAGDGGRLAGGHLQRGPRCDIDFDGVTVRAYRGETVAGALLAAGFRTFRATVKRGDPRGFYCGIGFCHDCLVTIDERPRERACLVAVEPGMRISSLAGWAAGDGDPA